MKARSENGSIVIYNTLPSKYVENGYNIVGGFHLLPTEIHEEEGFYDLVEPTLVDQEIEFLGDLYFDDVNKIFTYYIIQNPNIPSTLEEAKTLKINELKKAVKGLYAVITGYVIEKQLYEELIPQETKDKIKEIKTKYQQTKASIEALTSIIDVYKYKIPYVQINALKTELESIE